MASVFTTQLKEGMVTSADTFSDDGKLILPKDTVITNSVINRLVKNDVIFVEISEGADDGPGLSAAAKDEADDLINLLKAEENPIVEKPEYKKFLRRYDKNVSEMKDHLNDVVKKNAPLEVDTMLKNTMSIVHAAGSPLSVFTMMSTLKDYDDYTFNHSLNVSLICNIFAGWLGLSESDTELITTCGLLHDIGKLLIPDSIIAKPGKLTNEEFAVIKTHPKKGYEILKKQNVDLHVQYAALMHHEKMDGSGYPLGLSGDQIDWCAQIVTIADIYEALTAKRVYRGPLSPFTVIDMFEEDGLKKYNPRYLLTFLEHVVNSYMNCKVRLSNGEEGDIVFINKVRMSKPMIKTKTSFLDLSKSDVKIESVL